MRRVKSRSRLARMQRRSRKNHRMHLKKNHKNLNDLPIKARLPPNPHLSPPKSSKLLPPSRLKSLQKNLSRVINLIRKIKTKHPRSWHPNPISVEVAQNKKKRKILR